MTAIVLQARLDSSRLPEKAMLPLDGKPVIFRVMQALSNVTANIRILACTQDSFSAFSPIAEEAGFKIIAGSKEDVLQRYCDAIREFDIKRIIRATGDNPFVFADAASSINAEAMALSADYAGYSGIPYGSGVESVCASALLRAEKEAASPFEKEHVCPYLYNNPQTFSLHRPLAPLRWQGANIRLTIDTREDYERAVRLYDALKDEPLRYHGGVIIKSFIRLNGLG